MKKYFLHFLLFIIIGNVAAQQRDLNFYIEQAKTNSPLIQKNKNDTKIIQLDLQQTERILKCPVISLESSILFAPVISHDTYPSTFQLATANSVKYTGYDLGATSGGQYQAYISASQPLLGRMNYKVYSSRADIARKQNDNSTILTVHEIEQLVGYQYILCLKSKTQIKNSDIIIQQLDEQLNVMHKLVQNAVYKQSDLMLLEIEKQNLEVTNQSFKNDYNSNLYDLNLICGVKDSTQAEIAEINLQIKPENPSNSQFLTSYNLDSLSIIANQSINELKYKPQLNAFANAGYNATGIPTFDRFGLSAGLTFSWNIYDGGQRKLERQKSNVSINTLLFEKNHFMSQQEINKNKIRNQIKSLDERGVILENQLIQYDKLYKVYENELSQGLVSVMDFKNLLKDFTSKKQDYLLLKMEKQLLINSYNYWNY